MTGVTGTDGVEAADDEGPGTAVFAPVEDVHEPIALTLEDEYERPGVESESCGETGYSLPHPTRSPVAIGMARSISIPRGEPFMSTNPLVDH